MWYFQHQRARQILAERVREADRIRLARLVQRSEQGDTERPRHAALASLRRAAASAAFVVGRSATRFAEAIDVENETACAN
jgi:hypothetical protein